MSRGREKLKLVLPLGCLSGHSLPTKVTCACCMNPLVHAALVSSSFKSHLRPIFLFLRRRGRLTPVPKLRLVEKLASLRSCDSLISPMAHCLFFFNLTPGVSPDLYGVENILRKFLVPFSVIFHDSHASTHFGIFSSYLDVSTMLFKLHCPTRILFRNIRQVHESVSRIAPSVFSKTWIFPKTHDFVQKLGIAWKLQIYFLYGRKAFRIVPFFRNSCKHKRRKNAIRIIMARDFEAATIKNQRSHLHRRAFDELLKR